MKCKTAFALLLLLYPVTAWSQDTLKTQVLEEVTVVSENHKTIKDGIEYISTPEERRRLPTHKPYFQK